MAVVTITLTDEDLDLGRFSAAIDVEDAKLDDGFMTAAHLTGVFMLKHLHSPEFQKLCWDFANELASNPGCSIQNPGYSPDHPGEIAAA